MPDRMLIVDHEAPIRSAPDAGGDRGISAEKAAYPNIPARPPAAGGPRWRVLVVEDESYLQDVHRRLLRKIGVEVLVAASGVEARHLIRSEAVDLVISDVKMPGELNGIMLFEWLATERPQLAERFIFVTGNTQDLTLPSLREGRPSRLLTKPFQMEEYLAQVSALLEEERPTVPGPRPASARGEWIRGPQEAR
jgi:CheY-like chemotaxis protein